MFKLKFSAAVTPSQSPRSSASDFTSAVAAIREQHQRVGVLKDEVAAAERALRLAIANKDVLEISGEDPGVEVRRKQVALDQTRRRYANAKIDLARMLVDEGRRRAEYHAESWKRSYLELVTPRVERLATAQQLLESAVKEIIGVLHPDSVEMRRLAALDEAENAWNSLCRELAAPGNAALANIAPMTKAIFSSFSQSVKLNQFEVALSRLRDALNPPPAPIPPLTEEQIIRDREIAAESLRVGIDRLESEKRRDELSRRAELASLAKPAR